jgi:hypothetical protein
MSRNNFEDNNHECDKCGKAMRTGTTMISVTIIGERERQIICPRCACQELLNDGHGGLAHEVDNE